MNTNIINDHLCDAAFHEAVDNFLNNVNTDYLVPWPTKQFPLKNISDDLSLFDICTRCKSIYEVSGDPTQVQKKVFFRVNEDKGYIRYGTLSQEFYMADFRNTAVEYFFKNEQADRVYTFLLFIFGLKTKTQYAFIKLSLKDLLEKFSGRNLYFDGDLDDYAPMLSDLLKMGLIASYSDTWYDNIHLTELGDRVLNKLLLMKRAEDSEDSYSFTVFDL